MRADSTARVAISTVAVASGTGAFIALATGHRTTAIGFALLGGVLGVASAFGTAIEREAAPAPRRPIQAPIEVVPVSSALAGFLNGRR